MPRPSGATRCRHWPPTSGSRSSGSLLPDRSPAGPQRDHLRRQRQPDRRRRRVGPVADARRRTTDHRDGRGVLVPRGAGPGHHRRAVPQVSRRPLGAGLERRGPGPGLSSHDPSARPSRRPGCHQIFPGRNPSPTRLASSSSPSTRQARTPSRSGAGVPRSSTDIPVLWIGAWLLASGRTSLSSATRSCGSVSSTSSVRDNHGPTSHRDTPGDRTPAVGPDLATPQQANPHDGVTAPCRAPSARPRTVRGPQDRGRSP